MSQALSPRLPNGGREAGHVKTAGNSIMEVLKATIIIGTISKYRNWYTSYFHVDIIPILNKILPTDVPGKIFMRGCQCYSSAIYPWFIYSTIAFQAFQSMMRDEKRLLERWVGPKEREEVQLG